jgi:hypothetical protein
MLFFECNAGMGGCGVGRGRQKVLARVHPGAETKGRKYGLARDTDDKDSRRYAASQTQVCATTIGRQVANLAHNPG